MVNTILTRIKNRIRKNNNSHHFSKYLMDEYGFYVGDYFIEILGHERKRTERSKKPFLVMLLNIEGFSLDNKRRKIIKKIASALFSSTREIDIKGWYKHDSDIGVIFTELNGTDRVSLKETIYTNLCKVLHREVVRKIKISFYFYPEFFDDHEDDSSEDLTLYPGLPKRKGNKKTSALFKRLIDVVGSIAGLIIFSPFFIVIPLSIKMTSRGPVFFRQGRIGESGKRFTFLKFRSMYINNDPNVHKEYIKKLILEQKSYEEGNGNGEGKVFKIKDDPRITPIGKFLRKTSLDEIPQFINVLKGDMSLVGPRPPIQYEIENYDLWHKRRVMEVKPGITGLWQVRGRSSTTFDEMVRLDIRYIRNWSIWLDIKILFLTPWVVLSGKGAY